MNFPVKVLEIPRDAKPEARAVPVSDFAVSADTLEDARRAALARLAADGRPVRTLSFTADGGLAAVVFPAEPPAQAPAQPARRRRGGR
jgi:hypothetical protein